MGQLHPSSGQPAGPLWPPAPAPVRTAVKLMYAGGAVSAMHLTIGLALIIVDIKTAARGRFWGVSVTVPQVRPILITVWIVVSLVVIALWLWMARANGQGRNWARILSVVLFSLATLQLIGDLQQVVSPAGTIEPVLGLLLAMLGWLAGLAAVWLLWRPDSSAFFKPQGLVRHRHSAIGASRAEQGITLCIFHGQRRSMKERAMTAVPPGACLNGPHTRTCRDYLCVPWGGPRPWRLTPSSRQMRSGPNEPGVCGAARGASQIVTSSGRSGPEPMTREG